MGLVGGRYLWITMYWDHWRRLLSQACGNFLLKRPNGLMSVINHGTPLKELSILLDVVSTLSVESEALYGMTMMETCMSLPSHRERLLQGHGSGLHSTSILP